MKPIIILSLFFILLEILPVELIAQEDVQVKLGSRIRISTTDYIKNKIIYKEPKGYILIGTILGLKADNLILNVKDDDVSITIPLVSVNKLEVSQGIKKSRTAQGILIGSAVGITAGYIHADLTDRGGDLDPRPFGGLFGGLIGAFVGATIGSSMGGDQWKEVPLEQIKMGIY